MELGFKVNWRVYNDPLLASLGGLGPPPSDLTDPRSEAHSSSSYRIPMLGASPFQGRGVSAPAGSPELHPHTGSSPPQPSKFLHFYLERRGFQL